MLKKAVLGVDELHQLHTPIDPDFSVNSMGMVFHGLQAYKKLVSYLLIGFALANLFHNLSLSLCDLIFFIDQCLFFGNGVLGMNWPKSEI